MSTFYIHILILPESIFKTQREKKIWINFIMRGIQSIEKALRKDTDRFFLKNMHYGRHLFISEFDTERS